jgi:Mg-chelatase subunit ChlD
MDQKRTATGAIVAGAVGVVAIAAILGHPAGGKTKRIEGSQPVASSQRPRVEVVFALDTTGSMGGLIAGAKAKIWSIAGHIASGQPAPEVKIGLVAYRDVGDAYVTRSFPLTEDLDATYTKLMELRADGGGDEPEHVNQALSDAIHKMEWSDGAMKMIFLVGDAPAHEHLGLSSVTLAAEAARKGITIHAVRCGDSRQAEDTFRRVAEASNGSFTTIDQGGGVVAIATPYDEQMAELNRRYTSTAMIVGGEDARRRMDEKARAVREAPASSGADRGGFFAMTGAKMDADDKLDVYAAKPAAIAAEPVAALPPEMRAMEPKDREEYVKTKAKERAEVKAEMARLAAKRNAYLETEGKKEGGGGKDGFDVVVKGAIEKDAEKHGIKFEKKR